MIKKIILWFLVIFTCCMIFTFSSDNAEISRRISHEITTRILKLINIDIDVMKDFDGENFDTMHKAIRKVAHAAEFALLALFTVMLARSYNLSLKTSVIIALSFSLCYSISDEIHQLFIDGRAGRVSDVLIDFLGSLFSVSIFCLFNWILHRKRTKKAYF